MFASFRGTLFCDTTVVHPGNAARFVRQRRLDGSPLIVREYVAHGWRLRFWEFESRAGRRHQPNPSRQMRISCFTSAFGDTADMVGLAAGLVPVANDPACVKTHTWAKCRKCNSPVWHPTVRPQHYQFSLRAISPRCFYARGGRWSFHTAWAMTGHCCVVRAYNSRKF